MSHEPGNVARGLKAAISNPRVGPEAKESAQERLDQMIANGELGETAHEAQILRGHKASLFI
ncbi:hypothetical protein EIP86_002971 [Pleurotus ostreatoroseus]|nr:hypothetical protein EIP86_002971 [Pleurotus ostreatoroseus]